MNFVGNIPVDYKPKQLWKVFKHCGKIEKIWFRSIAPESFITNKTNIAKGKMYGDQKNNKNAYILFESDASIPAALELNNFVIQDEDSYNNRSQAEYPSCTLPPFRTFPYTAPHPMSPALAP